MADDLIDLPARKMNYPSVENNSTTGLGVVLNEQQVGQLIETSSKIVEGTVAIARDLVEIGRIRAQSQSEVEVIRARSQALVVVLRAETDRVMLEHDGVRTRSEAAISIIQAIMKNIPEADQSSRVAAIDILNDLVKTVLATEIHSK